MSNPTTIIQNPSSAGAPAQGPESSLNAPKRIGLIIAFLVFGVFGTWAATAPLDGSAHGPGVVTVKSYKKVIQHLEGGMVSDILVRNGDYVKEGDPLLILDSTQSRAQLQIINAQLLGLTALESRLVAERDQLTEVVYPELLRESGGLATAEMDDQNQVFRTRKIAREGVVAVLEQRIEQLQSQLGGMRAQKEVKEELAASFLEELEETRILLRDGFADRTRLRELERNYAQMRGDAEDLTANISSTQIEIGETRLQILQQDHEFNSEVAGLLAETRTQLKDVNERTLALQDVVARAVLRAPVDGIITGLQIHTIGGVIGPGAPIADIVPQSEELIVESRISLLDIDRVSIGKSAMIRFSSFSSQTVPTVYGTLIGLSADSVVDEVTGASYYLARIEVSPEGLEELGDLVLMQGMPAEVFISTGSRTLLQYLLKPISNSLARSLTED